MLQAALPTYGFAVLTAANGAEGLELYRQHGERIQLVLMDVNMQGLSGPETLARLIRMDEQVRCCFMSGDTSAQRWPELLKLGALSIIAKPFSSLQELARTLRSHL